jgi:hypothetical protein
VPVLTSRRPLALAAALVCVGALGVTACSSDDPTATPRTTAPGAEQLIGERWVEDANLICYRTEAKAASVYAGLDAGADDTAVAVVYRERMLPLIRAEIDAIAALEAPADRQADIDRFLDSARDAIAEVEEADVESLATGNDPFTYASIQARKLGLSCGDDES